MDLFLIRHAKALALGEGGVTEDADRSLSEDGEEQARRLAPALEKHGVRLESILSSPFLRARQTAEILIDNWSRPAPELHVVEALAPGCNCSLFTAPTGILLTIDSSRLADANPAILIDQVEIVVGDPATSQPYLFPETPAGALRSSHATGNPEGQAIFAELGSGPVYGYRLLTQRMNGRDVRIPLNTVRSRGGTSSMLGR